MIKANQFNSLLNEIHKKDEEKKRQEIRLQREIQLQMRLVENALYDMENKFKQAIDGKCEYPKFALVKFPLHDEVKKELIMNQGYLLDESFGQTKIFYNKEIFDNYRKNTKQEPKVENKSNEKIPHNKEEFEESITKLLKNILGDEAKIKCYRGGF
ncbi:hypothetical protein [Clostridium beijerinckii]|uniref:hypothetical protein n=1 Tax=Clostridium beijerinckii TaxID=1520 RepID=UPI00156F8731|nr:hypothetical protein [Clostridium beijerinckii]NRU52384.1 uncharacterized protein YtpQ (UPF0354 family) [Clostridium beijerinckii]NRU52683.1 uncharacterized protein YtpQ (UPF0354 family) [Clostridium beijerinckii]NYC68726.1 uncharacterized protein YtpQ (UPF0354 family) [Clostridium beijerinckii]NYC91875.1 uncharacterized protein YtpQ (UPF0354 family) [Clostridium beijerinckii]